MSNIQKILSDNGYSKEMVSFFDSAHFPISQSTLRLAEQGKDFFEIYMSYARDVQDYSSLHPNLFSSSEQYEDIIASFEKRYKECFLSSDGDFVFPLRESLSKSHFWETGGKIEHDY